MIRQRIEEECAFGRDTAAAVSGTGTLGDTVTNGYALRSVRLEPVRTRIPPTIGGGHYRSGRVRPMILTVELVVTRKMRELPACIDDGITHTVYR